MGLLEGKFSTGYIWTTSSIGATGATTLVAAPVTNSSLVVFHLRVVNLTATTAQVEGGFGDTTGAINNWNLTPGNAAGLMLDVDFASGWVLNTASALSFAATIAAASTPSLRVSALVRTLYSRAA